MLSGSILFAQKKLADKFFDNYGYAKAIELYEQVVEKGDSSVYVLTRLGDSYYNNANSEKAAFWYGEALIKIKISMPNTSISTSSPLEVLVTMIRPMCGLKSLKPCRKVIAE